MPVTTRSGRVAKITSTVKSAVKEKKPGSEPRVATMKHKAGRSKTIVEEEAVNPLSSNANTTPLYFWRETDHQTGWLSQWYMCDFTDAQGSVIYKTAEHYMMYHKALLFSDPVAAANILAAKHPRQVRAMGRKVRGFDDAVWNAERERIVREGSCFKFTRPLTKEGDKPFRLGTSPSAPYIGHASLRALLLSTGGRELVEASPYDAVWGIGLTAAAAEQTDRDEVWGLNLLGKALMHVREQLRREDEEEEERKEKEVKERQASPSFAS
ncbi:hypothetical protein B0T17DRAFT_537930 [Bombardia bombarda]|uniref:NADAR domain-containing protein n=1 Tax=Bombardia bombarda TaxID=252184 RepID=A0AA39WN20_9PEZI|nr:hypothetical protein B0T17DRAFT_537930 [Bombardia bombarda]